MPSRMILLTLPAVLAFLALPPGAWAQTLSEGQDYLVLDFYVASDGNVFFIGETNKADPILDPRLGSFPIRDGRFSNTTDQLTDKVGANWTFSFSVADAYSWGLVTVYLPPGAKVMNVSPEGSWGIFEEKGGLVVTFLEFQSTDELVVRYELGPVGSLRLGSYVLPAIAVAAACAAIVLALKFLWPRLKAPAEGTAQPARLDQGKWDAICPTLTEREKRVLENIVKEGGRISQRKLRHLCDLPKSTLSRVTDELQRKGLVRKIPVGQTNEIRLDERLLVEGE